MLPSNNLCFELVYCLLNPAKMICLEVLSGSSIISLIPLWVVVILTTANDFFTSHQSGMLVNWFAFPHFSRHSLVFEAVS